MHAFQVCKIYSFKIVYEYLASYILEPFNAGIFSNWSLNLLLDGNLRVAVTMQHVQRVTMIIYDHKANCLPLNWQRDPSLRPSIFLQCRWKKYKHNYDINLYKSVYLEILIAYHPVLILFYDHKGIGKKLLLLLLSFLKINFICSNQS